MTHDKDYCEQNHGGAATSRDAFAKTPDKVRMAQRLAIVKAIEATGAAGMTCDEVETALSLPHQTASARISEMLHQDVIRDTGRQRKTRRGRGARVYVYDDPLAKKTKPDLGPVQKELF